METLTKQEGSLSPPPDLQLSQNTDSTRGSSISVELLEHGEITNVSQLDELKAKTLPDAIQEILLVNLSLDKHKTEGFQKLSDNPHYMRQVFENGDHGEIVRAFEALPMNDEVKKSFVEKFATEYVQTA